MTGRNACPAKFSITVGTMESELAVAKTLVEAGAGTPPPLCPAAVMVARQMVRMPGKTATSSHELRRQ